MRDVNDANPYSAPSNSSKSTAESSGSVVLKILFIAIFVIGCCNLLVAVHRITVIAQVRVPSTRMTQWIIEGALFEFACYGSFGLSWTIAAVGIARRRWLLAFWALAIGIVAPILINIIAGQF